MALVPFIDLTAYADDCSYALITDETANTAHPLYTSAGDYGGSNPARNTLSIIVKAFAVGADGNKTEISYTIPDEETADERLVYL